jgi:hypothetical protein
MQTLVANFVKNPTVSPAPGWPKYIPGNRTTTLAKLAYNGNVELNNVVQVVGSDSMVRDQVLFLHWVEVHSICRTLLAVLCGTGFWMLGSECRSLASVVFTGCNEIIIKRSP